MSLPQLTLPPGIAVGEIPKGELDPRAWAGAVFMRPQGELNVWVEFFWRRTGEEIAILRVQAMRPDDDPQIVTTEAVMSKTDAMAQRNLIEAWVSLLVKTGFDSLVLTLMGMCAAHWTREALGKTGS